MKKLQRRFAPTHLPQSADQVAGLLRNTRPISAEYAATDKTLGIVLKGPLKH